MNYKVNANKALNSFLSFTSEVNWITLFFLLPVSFIFGNWRITSALVFIYFLFFIFDKFFCGKDIRIKFKIPLILIIITGMIGALLSPKLGFGQDYFIGTVIVPVLLFISITNIELSYSGITKFIYLNIFACIVLCIYTIYLISVIGTYSIRLSSLWQDVNIVAAYYMIIFFFIFTFIVHFENYKQLFIYTLVLIPVALGMFLTQTRNVWISVLVSLFIYVLKKPKVIIPSLILVGILGLQFRSIVLDRFLSIKYFTFDTSALGRFQAWVASIALIKQHWLLGIGYDSFPFMKNTVIESFVIDVEHSHNTYLRLMLETGVIGFFSYISFFVLALLFSFKLKKKFFFDKRYIKIIEALQLSFIGLSISFIFEPYFSLFGNSTVIIWILIAFTFNLYYLDPSRTNK